jgi:signal transduction histidine kinase/putative methionine-R-sulfoxide reductase with GAF domain
MHAENDPPDSTSGRLATLLRQLATATGQADVHRIACRSARSLTGADGAAFIVRGRTAAVLAAEDADEPLGTSDAPALADWVMQHETAAVVEDASTDDARGVPVVRSLAIVPVGGRGGAPRAALAVYWRHLHRADADQLRALEVVADATSFALAAAWLEAAADAARREAEAKAERLRVVQRITDAALADLTVDAFLTELLVRVREALGGDTATLLVVDEREAALLVRAAVGLEVEVQEEVRVPLGRGFAGRIASTLGPIVLEEVDYESVVSRYIRLKSLRSMAGVPLLAEGRLIGVLHVGSMRPRRFGDADVELLQLAAERIAVAMERATAHEAERQARAAAEEAERRAAFLAEASAALVSSLDYEDTLRTLAQLTVPFLADWCSVDMVEPDRSVRRVALAHANPAKAAIARAAATYPADPDGRHPRTRVLRTGASELIPDVTPEGLAQLGGDEAYRRALAALAYRSAIIVALAARGQVFGAITLATAESGRRYGPADLAVAEELARRASAAIDNARLYRQAQEANRLKDEFLSIVSHELRTPLAAMLGWVRVLRLDKGERAARAIETIERSGRAQEKLIEDLLDASRMITGRLCLEMERVDFQPVVAAALETVRPAAEAKGVSVDVALGASAVTVLGDADRLQQVVWNLLSNAVKFTPAGGTVEVRTAVTRDVVDLVVSDTGTGITADFLPYVFDRFRQAEPAASRGRGGLGLGLAIVRHLVEAHGGTVAVTSAGEGRGATFTVTLPLAEARLARVGG